SSAAEILDHSAADRNALVLRRSTRCRCRCDRRAADLLRAPVEEGRDIAAREKLSRREISPKIFCREAVGFPRDASSVPYNYLLPPSSFSSCCLRSFSVCKRNCQRCS